LATVIGVVYPKCIHVYTKQYWSYNGDHDGARGLIERVETSLVYPW